MFRQLSRQIVKALPKPRFVYSCTVHNTPIPHSGPNRKSNWITYYSKMTQEEAQERLGFRIQELKAVPVGRILESLEWDGPGATLKTKERVYDRIVEYLDVEGYPMEGLGYFGVANINHLVYSITSTILFDLRRKTGRKSLQLRSEREIASPDDETGGNEEFVVMDLISVTHKRFVLIVQAMRSSLAQAMRQCLLSMKDARDNNGGGDVYAFITTGSQWQMIGYNGTSFVATEEFIVLFHTMGVDKKRWMKDYSVVVDCMYTVLSNGAFTEGENTVTNHQGNIHIFEQGTE